MWEPVSFEINWMTEISVWDLESNSYKESYRVELLIYVQIGNTVYNMSYFVETDQLHSFWLSMSVLPHPVV